MWKKLRGNPPSPRRPPGAAGDGSGNPADRRQRSDRRQHDLGLPPGVARDRRQRVEQRKPRVEEIPMAEWEAHRAGYFALLAPIPGARGQPDGLVEWGPGMDSGVAAIDGQNRALVTKLNAINLWIKAGESPAFLRDILREFLSYVRTHLDAQIRHLRESAHPRAAAHSALHRRLLLELDDAFIRFERGDLDAAMLHRALVGPLVAHIEDDDSQVGRLNRLSGAR